MCSRPELFLAQRHLQIDPDRLLRQGDWLEKDTTVTWAIIEQELRP
jgi:hypothetical protein